MDLGKKESEVKLLRIRERNETKNLNGKKPNWNWGAALGFFVTVNYTVFFVVSLSGWKGNFIGLLISLVGSNWFAYISLQDYLAFQERRRLKNVNQTDVSDSK